MNTSFSIKLLSIYKNYPSRTVRPGNGRFPGNSGDFMEGVFGPEIFRTFSNDFRSIPAGKHRNLTGIYRKKSENFPTGIVLSCRIWWPEWSTWVLIKWNLKNERRVFETSFVTQLLYLLFLSKWLFLDKTNNTYIHTYIYVQKHFSFYIWSIILFITVPTMSFISIIYCWWIWANCTCCCVFSCCCCISCWWTAIGRDGGIF